MRLTNEMRDIIAKRVLTHRFEKSLLEFYERRAALAKSVYDDVFTEGMQADMRKLPEGWLPRCSTIKIQFGVTGSAYDEMHFNGVIHNSMTRYIKKRPDTICKLLPFRFRDHCVRVYNDDHMLAQSWQDLQDQHGNLHSNIKMAERQMEQALGRASSIKKLLELWPEMAPFVQDFLTQKTSVPAIPTAQLNALFKLPV